MYPRLMADPAPAVPDGTPASAGSGHLAQGGPGARCQTDHYAWHKGKPGCEQSAVPGSINTNP
jgi:hypothetical protein